MTFPKGRFVYSIGDHARDIPAFFLHFFYCEAMDFLISYFKRKKIK